MRSSLCYRGKTCISDLGGVYTSVVRLQDMKRRVERGESYYSIARGYGITRTRVGAIMRQHGIQSQFYRRRYDVIVQCLKDNPGLSYRAVARICKSAEGRVRIVARKEGLERLPIPFIERGLQADDYAVEGECWIWTRATSNGWPVYGSHKRGQESSAHRFVYESTHGAIPVGGQVRRTCRKRLCVRPEHLYMAGSRNGHHR